MKQTNRTAALWAGAVAVIAIAGAGATLSLLAAPARAASAAAAEHTDPQLIGWAFLGAALSTGLAALPSRGWAVRRSGRSPRSRSCSAGRWCSSVSPRASRSTA